MPLIRKIKPDKYLKKFIDNYKLKYGKNLIAIAIYGSYAFGYFDKDKSDYDIIVLFKNKVPKIEGVIPLDYPKVFFQYFCNTKYLLDKIKEGHWTLYITLLKSSRILYFTKDYIDFLKKLERFNPPKEKIKELTRKKIDKELKAFKENKGYNAAKWIFPCIRKRLQILIYLKTGEKIWDIEKSVKSNKDILSKKESKFIVNLDKKVKQRSENFKGKDRKMALNILRKLNRRLT